MYKYIVRLSNGKRWERVVNVFSSEAACLAGEKEANAYIMRNGLKDITYIVEVKND